MRNQEKNTVKALAKPTAKPVAKPAVKPAAKPRAAVARQPRARRAMAGDVPPKLNEGAVERFVVGESVSAAQESKITAVKDIIASAGGGPAFIESLEAILKGASPEDAAALKDALLRPSVTGLMARHPDEELAEGWREGGYPYKNLMSRKNYEREKYKLQVELL